MDRAMRSLTEPPGFWPSSLARMRTRGAGLSPLTSTSGVSPMRSSPLAYSVMVPRGQPGRSGSPRAAGHRRQDRYHAVVRHLGGEPVEVADVVVVQVHVDELVEGALLRDHLAPHGGELADQVLQHLAHAPAVGLDRGLASRVLTEDGGQADFDGHGPSRMAVRTRIGNQCYRSSTTTGSSLTFPSTIRNDRVTGASSRSATTT